jgi:hypothetical protein
MRCACRDSQLGGRDHSRFVNPLQWHNGDKWLSAVHTNRLFGVAAATRQRDRTTRQSPRYRSLAYQRLRSVNDRAGVGCRSVDQMKQRTISSRLCSRSIGEPITQTEAHQQWRLGVFSYRLAKRRRASMVRCSLLIAFGSLRADAAASRPAFEKSTESTRTAAHGRSATVYRNHPDDGRF